MNAIVSVREAKAHFLRLLERAHAGEEVIIGKAGKPYARLVPFEPPAKRRLGFMDGTVDQNFFEPLPDGELNAWKGGRT